MLGDALGASPFPLTEWTRNNSSRTVFAVACPAVACPAVACWASHRVLSSDCERGRSLRESMLLGRQCRYATDMGLICGRYACLASLLRLCLLLQAFLSFRQHLCVCVCVCVCVSLCSRVRVKYSYTLHATPSKFSGTINL